MEKSIFLLLVVYLVHQATAGCKEPVDCEAVVAIDGVSLTPCPHVPDGGGGNGNSNPGESVECCTETTYEGPESTRYYYDGSCPVYLKFTDLQLDDGETLMVRNLLCDDSHEEDHHGCHIALIDNTAVTPFIIPVSSSYFTLSSDGDELSATFKVINEECDPSCCDPCGPMWTLFGGKCYRLNNRLREWTFHKDFCWLVHGAIIAPIYDEQTWNFLYGFAGDETWLGLHCRDDNNTVWYWNTPRFVPPAPLTMPEIWDSTYPRPSTNRHCAGFLDDNKYLRNGGCDVHRKSVCCRDLV